MNNMRSAFFTLKLSVVLLSGAIAFSSAENGQLNTSKLKYELRHHRQVVQHVVSSKNRLEMVALKLRQVNSKI